MTTNFNEHLNKIKNGFDTFQDMLRDAGATNIQVHSKVAEIAYRVITGCTAEVIKEMANNDDMIMRQKEEISALEKTRDLINVEIKLANARLAKIKEDRNTEIGKVRKYLEDFHESLKSCEDPEARDTLRTAQFFINSVCQYEVRHSSFTSEEKVAFTEGLAKILYGKKVPQGIDALNPTVGVHV